MARDKNKPRINKTDIIRNMRDSSALTLEISRLMYELMLDEVVHNTIAGTEVVVTGLGVFELKKHKRGGGLINLNSENQTEEVYVLGFRPAKVLTRRIREAIEKNNGELGEGALENYLDICKELGRYVPDVDEE